MLVHGWRRAKRPGEPGLQGAYGHPWHPMVVTVPLGTWSASLVFDVASHAGTSPAALATGSAWLIAIGTVVGLPAAVIGYLDLRGVPTGGAAMRTGLLHTGLALAALTIYASDFLLRWSGGLSGSVPWGLFALSLIGYALIVVAGRLGARLAYRYGVRVADAATQAQGYEPRETAGHGDPDERTGRQVA